MRLGFTESQRRPIERQPFFVLFFSPFALSLVEGLLTSRALNLRRAPNLRKDRFDWLSANGEKKRESPGGSLRRSCRATSSRSDPNLYSNSALRLSKGLLTSEGLLTSGKIASTGSARTEIEKENRLAAPLYRSTFSAPPAAFSTAAAGICCFRYQQRP